MYPAKVVLLHTRRGSGNATRACYAQETTRIGSLLCTRVGTAYTRCRHLVYTCRHRVKLVQAPCTRIGAAYSSVKLSQDVWLYAGGCTCRHRVVVAVEEDAVLVVRLLHVGERRGGACEVSPAREREECACEAPQEECCRSRRAAPLTAA
jgi:hypothetical protein